jgi:hypothetical protein
MYSLSFSFYLQWGHSCAVVALLGLCTVFYFISFSPINIFTTVGVSLAVSFQKKKTKQIQQWKVQNLIVFPAH